MVTLKQSLLRVFALIVLTLGSASAAVLERAENGFVMESSVQVAATPQQAYQQFLRIHEWWDPAHSWFGDAANFKISPKAGACFCEIDGSRQVEHMRVVFVHPDQEIRLLGGLGPLQMMGVHGAMSWRFELNENGSTIIHRYAVSGFSKGGLGALAEVVDRVQTGQLTRLAARLNQ